MTLVSYWYTNLFGSLAFPFKENLNELTGKYYPTSSFVDYRADVEAPLPMIYQSGYLTIKDWNMNMDSYLWISE